MAIKENSTKIKYVKSKIAAPAARFITRSLFKRTEMKAPMNAAIGIITYLAYIALSFPSETAINKKTTKIAIVIALTIAEVIRILLLSF